jgi:hypothetical protein
LKEVKTILDNQQEVKYLTYFISQDEKTGHVEAELSTLHITKQYNFKNSAGLLNKLVDILFELKRLEKWALTNLDKGKK